MRTRGHLPRVVASDEEKVEIVTMSETVRSELSAAALSVDAYRERVASLVDHVEATREDVIAAIYEAERALISAYRALLRAEKAAR